MGRLRHLLSVDRPDLKDKPFVPITRRGLPGQIDEDIFARIRQADVLLHHPFESFQPVVELLRKAARDPDVLAIKMTLYRVGRNSPIVEALLEAIENGKQVAVLVELKARFDEESNIEWARALEREGVHVVYGLVGLKVHSESGAGGAARRRHSFAATFIWPPATTITGTARLYTDLGFFTTDEQIGADVTDFFNFITGYSAKSDFRQLLVAPVNYDAAWRNWSSARSSTNSRATRSSHLQDERVRRSRIDQLLYRASQAGVASRSAGARYLLSAPRPARRQREHSCDEYSWPIPGT